MTQCIQYVSCYGKVVLPFKTRPYELAALMLGPAASLRQPARLAAKGRKGSTSSMLVEPCRRLPSLKLSR
jgi:hypothetical protein